ncbi:MAG: LpqB family beta-propeller domain-containing protein [Intrasporangium sp.]|uniref:GerMN domain-containing protein n=1 Tax=Intrasporangium sp. TaxID=1925024 RepID=UPI0026481865|nr:GerMN domain-containing protein [Intrasporangium sp.]MDN5797196.1 LpqB family beta-propeller domain-containing protein [Intrasporangium sp.]
MSLRKRLVAAALSVVAVLGVSACGGLPGDGPVLEGRRLDDPIGDPVRVLPQGPVDGASQEQIVLGFIRANEDVDESRETGKAYLAPQSPDLWRWTSADVIVYDTADDLKVKRLGPEEVEVSTVAVARVSADGRYVDLPARTRTTVTFGLTKVAGQWRIQLPRTGFGLWLDSAAFDRLYEARRIYYVTPSGRLLVSDIRWFPSGSRMVTTLARAQLAAVPDYLVGAVRTGVPTGTKLSVNAVPVNNGRAQVNLTEAALKADPIERRAMWAQLAATLGQVPAVQAVGLAVEGVELEMPGIGTWVSDPGELGYGRAPASSYDTALVRAGTTFSRVDPRAIPDSDAVRKPADTDQQAGDPTSIPTEWTRLALSVDGKEVAALRQDQTELSRWRGGRWKVLPPFATVLASPTYDTSGYLWVGGIAPDGKGGLWATHTDASTANKAPQRVAAHWLSGRRVTAIALSPEGARLLVISTDAAGHDARLDVAGIIRAPSGEPTGLSAPWRQGQPLTRLRDVVWLDGDSYAVLGRISPKDPVRPWTGTVGGGLDGIRRQGRADPQDTRLAAVPDAVSITTVGGARGIMIVTGDGQVLARAGRTWPVVATGTDVLVPGR